jgi:MFS family permease
MWGAIGALGVASGPSLGALLITATDWRAAFWVNMPVCLTLIVIGSVVLVETTSVQLTHRPDLFGAAMVTVALASVALGLSQSESWGWFDVRTLAALLTGALLTVWFVRRQRIHPEPVLDMRLFDSRSFTVANTAAVAFFAGFAALGLNNVLFLRQVWGYSVIQAGLLSAIAPLTVALLAPFSGRLAARYGFRSFVIVGPLLLAAAVTLSRLALTTDPAPLRLVLFSEIAAVGIALFIPVNAAAAVSELPAQRLSVGGAVNNTSRQIGAVLGIALLVAVIGNGAAPAALLDGHRRGWVLIALSAITASLIGTRQPSRRAPERERSARSDHQPAHA